MQTPAEALSRAIKAKGSQEALAEALGVNQSNVSHWLVKARRGVPAEFCGPIEAATGVPRHELRPDIFPPPSEKASSPQAEITSEALAS